MDETLDAFARRATQEAIIAKRDRLLALRAEIKEQRAALLARLRRADRELADCRAAARLFDLEIEFPEEEEETSTAQRRVYEQALERAKQRRREQERAAGLAQVGDLRTVHYYGGGEAVALPSPSPSPPPSTPTPTPAPKLERPTIREIVLDYLQRAGATGAKAAEMRDYIERSYGDAIHEKTVGMTLYRLSNGKLVHREGHTWFFGPAPAETENPGGETPGSDNLL